MGILLLYNQHRGYTNLGGTSTGQSVITGVLKGDFVLHGSIVSQSTFSGNLSGTITISGSIDSISSIVGTLSVPGFIDLSGIVDIVSLIEGILKPRRSFIGDIDATSVILGRLYSVQDTVGYIIRKAYRMNSINTPNNVQLSNGLILINDMISNWFAEGLMVPCIISEVFDITIGQSIYTIGDNGDFDTIRPMKIISAYVRDVHNIDYTVVPTMTRWEYNANTDKNQVGIPSRIYYNPEYPLGEICFDYNPDEILTLFISSEKMFTEFLSIDNENLSAQLGNVTEVVFPLEYKEALIYNLAVRVSTEEDTVLSKIVISIAESSKNTIENLIAIDRLSQNPKIERIKHEVYA